MNYRMRTLKLMLDYEVHSNFVVQNRAMNFVISWINA